MTKQVPELTPRQKSLAIGILLGDGYCRKEGNLQIEQSSKLHGEYVAWLHDTQQLGEISGKLTKNIKHTHPKTQVDSFKDRFYTKPLFKEWREIWYEKNLKTTGYRKIIPPNIEELLDPISLAIWYVDDGCMPGRISVCCFSITDQYKLKEALENKFGLKVTIQKQGGKNQASLYIQSESYQKFYDIVSSPLAPNPEGVRLSTKG